MIKKFFSFGRQSAKPEAEQEQADMPVAEANEAAAESETAVLTPFEAHQAESRAKAAQKQQRQAALAAAAAEKAAAKREIDQAGLLIRAESSANQADSAEQAETADSGDEAADSANAAADSPKSWPARLNFGMRQSSRRLNQALSGIFGRRKLAEADLEELEDVLLQADLGTETALKITDALRAARLDKNISPEEIRACLTDEIAKVLRPCARALELDLSHKPYIILVVGVNGTGKTTTIGKLAAKLRAGGLSVMLAAGDTFRAAAIEQLHIWGKRTGAPVISSKLGGDAASLAYDAYLQAKQAGANVLLIDTAGRLQNKTELMDELAKIIRVLKKHDASAPHIVLQNLDATTGQNALNQVEIFRKTANVNGLVMTKLDGTARGGILVAIAAKYKLPIYFIGVGEDIADLEPFSAEDFAAAIAGG